MYCLQNTKLLIGYFPKSRILVLRTFLNIKGNDKDWMLSGLSSPLSTIIFFWLFVFDIVTIYFDNIFVKRTGPRVGARQLRERVLKQRNSVVVKSQTISSVSSLCFSQQKIDCFFFYLPLGRCDQVQVLQFHEASVGFTSYHIISYYGGKHFECASVQYNVAIITIIRV